MDGCAGEGAHQVMLPVQSFEGDTIEGPPGKYCGSPFPGNGPH